MFKAISRLRLPSATTVDGFAAWPLTKHLQLVTRAQNILGERVVTGLDENGTVERGTPRTLWIGLRLRTMP